MEPAPIPSVLPCWALVHLLGHQEHAGFVDEVEVCGVRHLRVTCPAIDETVGEPDEGGDVPVRTAIPERVIVVGVKALHSVEIATEAEVRKERADLRGHGWRKADGTAKEDDIPW